MRLRREVVDLVRLHRLDDADQVGRVGHVSVVENEPLILVVGILIDVVDTAGVERGRPALDAVDLVALGQQQFGEVRAVLSRRAGYEGDPGHRRLVAGHQPM